MVMVRVLYKLNSSGADWRKIADTLRKMDFVTTVDDQDIYRRGSRKPNDEDYHELSLVYVDDVLWCSFNTQLIMDALDLTYNLKDGSVVTPKIYLGTEIKKYQVGNGKSHWGISSTQYVKMRSI